MKELFKQLILEFARFELPEGLARDIEVPVLPSHVRKAITFIGMRRSGKTWALYQHMQKLLEQGVGRDKIVYINFEDERLNEVHSKDLKYLLDAYYEIYPENIDTERLFFYFDEIQVVTGWEKFIRRLIDAHSFDLYLSGSSAKLLSKEIATELRGRSLTLEVFPLTFPEYLRFYHVKINPHRLTTKERSLVVHHVRNYLRWGGFPETLGSSEWVHRETLQNYVNIVIYRDIVERHKISSVTVLEKWITHCLQNVAAPLSINKAYHHFKSLGLQVSKNSLYEWLEFIEDAYCLFGVKCYNLSERKSSLKPKKIYPVDVGLVSAYAVHPEMKIGASLESAVFRTLRESCDQIHYYSTEHGWEVDFLTQTLEGKMSLIQVCLSLKEEETRQREIRALKQAMKELQLEESLIVTLDEEEDLGPIQVVPIWKFLL